MYDCKTKTVYKLYGLFQVKWRHREASSLEQTIGNIKQVDIRMMGLTENVNPQDLQGINSSTDPRNDPRFVYCPGNISKLVKRNFTNFKFSSVGQDPICRESLNLIRLMFTTTNIKFIYGPQMKATQL